MSGTLPRVALCRISAAGLPTGPDSSDDQSRPETRSVLVVLRETVYPAATPMGPSNFLQRTYSQKSSTVSASLVRRAEGIDILDVVGNIGLSVRIDRIHDRGLQRLGPVRAAGKQVLLRNNGELEPRFAAG